MPIDGSVNLDRNDPDYGLPMDSCVGNGVGDPFAGGKDVPKAVAQQPGPSLRFVGGPSPSAKNWGS